MIRCPSSPILFNFGSYPARWCTMQSLRHWPANRHGYSALNPSQMTLLWAWMSVLEATEVVLLWCMICMLTSQMRLEAQTWHGSEMPLSRLLASSLWVWHGPCFITYIYIPHDCVLDQGICTLYTHISLSLFETVRVETKLATTAWLSQGPLLIHVAFALRYRRTSVCSVVYFGVKSYIRWTNLHASFWLIVNLCELFL